MSFFSYALGTLILVVVLLRQVRVRPVRRVFAPRLPLVLGVIGFFTMVSYAGGHHVSSSSWLWVLGSMLVGALGVDLIRLAKIPSPPAMIGYALLVASYLATGAVWSK